VTKCCHREQPSAFHAVRDLVTVIQQAEADDAVRVLVIKSADPDYFTSRRFQTRDGEMSLASLLIESP
jgi:hypothetical protein